MQRRFPLALFEMQIPCANKGAAERSSSSGGIRGAHGALILYEDERFTAICCKF